MVITVFLHMCRVFYTGSFRAPRQFNWVVGIILLVLTFLLSFTGYLLPWDQLAIWAITVGTNMIGSTPPPAASEYPLPAGGRLSSSARTRCIRFYTLHVIGLPLLLARLPGRALLAHPQGRLLARADLHLAHRRRRRQSFGRARALRAGVGRTRDYERSIRVSSKEHKHMATEARPARRVMPDPASAIVTDTKGAPVLTRAARSRPRRRPAARRGRHRAGLAASGGDRVSGRGGLHDQYGAAGHAGQRRRWMTLANPDRTPNPSKAPWYFLNLQELLLHMNPALAGRHRADPGPGGAGGHPLYGQGHQGAGRLVLQQARAAHRRFSGDLHNYRVLALLIAYGHAVP